MPDHLEELDSIYFSDSLCWSCRLAQWVVIHGYDDPFSTSARSAIELSFRTTHGDPGTRSLRMVVNMGAHTLLEFIANGTYQNVYDKAVLGHAGPSEMRTKVDEALSAEPMNLYFGAVTLSGTGVRFYGEYGVVLSGASIPGDTTVMDRNSWMIEFDPLKEKAPTISESESRKRTAKRISGTWDSDLEDMVMLKILPEVNRPVRLPTSGVVSEAVLSDESFVEVQKAGSFQSNEVHEVRETPQDAAIDSDVTERNKRGLPILPEESAWMNRRRQLADDLHSAGVSRRIVATSGRERG